MTALRELMMVADPVVRIEIRSFGVLEVKKTKANPSARVPGTQQTVFILARRKAWFRPGKPLREALATLLVERGTDADPV